MPQTMRPARATEDEIEIGNLDALEEYLRDGAIKSSPPRHIKRSGFHQKEPTRWTEKQLVAFVANSFAKPSTYPPKPAGYSASTLGSKDGFLEEFERQAGSWVDEEDVRYGLAEARLALGGDIPLEERLECIETLKRGQPKRGPGAHPLAHRDRDIKIMVNVDFVMRLGGLRATRNEASEHECACSIVARGLNECGFRISEKSVVRIYRRVKGSLTAHHPSTDALLRAQEWADQIYGTDVDLKFARDLELALVLARHMSTTKTVNEDVLLFETSSYRFVLNNSPS